MRTEKQIAASRANGAKSRGPKTPEGRARAGRGPYHGLLARALLLETESRDRFDDLVTMLNGTLNPTTPLDHLLIGKMAAAHWRQVRLWGRHQDDENASVAEELRLDLQFSRNFDRYLRFQTFLDRRNLTSDCSKKTSSSEPTRPQPKPTQSLPQPALPEPDATQPQPEIAS